MHGGGGPCEDEQKSDASRSQEMLRWLAAPRNRCRGQEWSLPQGLQKDPTLPTPDFSPVILISDLQPPGL